MTILSALRPRFLTQAYVVRSTGRLFATMAAAKTDLSTYKLNHTM